MYDMFPLVLLRICKEREERGATKEKEEKVVSHFSMEGIEGRS